MSDPTDNLLREIEQLRYALEGRTMSCAWCNAQAKKQDELKLALIDFLNWNKGSHGRKWLKAKERIEALLGVKL